MSLYGADTKNRHALRGDCVNGYWNGAHVNDEEAVRTDNQQQIQRPRLPEVFTFV